MTTAPTSQPDTTPEMTTEAVAELRGVRKVYYKPDGSVMVEALRGIDLTITKGQSIAIMGPSGSGKSTMMNVLGCLDRPTHGNFLLSGREVVTMDDEELSLFRGQTIGFVFQAFNLIPQLTIEENVSVPLFYQGIPKSERLKRAYASLERVGLGDRIGHRPRELSGGQQQRAAIARALVGNPVVIMADEPTGNLDSKTSDQILDLFDELHDDGKTIVMVTHDNEVSVRCQRIIRLRDGLVESDVLN